MHFEFIKLTYKALYPYQDLKSFILFRFVEPFFYFVFFILLGYTVLGNEYLNYLILGNVILIILRTVIFNLTLMSRYERLYGTIGLITSTRTSIFKIIILRMLIPILDAYFVATFSLFLYYTYFHVNINISNILLLFLLISSIIFSVSGFALIIASVGLVLRDINLILNISIGIFQVMSGINFPTNLLPIWLETISKILPVTNGLAAMRAALNGAGFYNVSHLLFNELLLGFLYFSLAFLLIKIMEKIAKQKSTLFN
ncbi:ABC transporter permease [Brevibacillus sp. SAFN-007a]|uniref:ABC transporter permease n=1 Tax=Brevibacillus sp. SAFN-007a TaxID=3436862 RepID=UPI003F7F2B62